MGILNPDYIDGSHIVTVQWKDELWATPEDNCELTKLITGAVGRYEVPQGFSKSIDTIRRYTIQAFEHALEELEVTGWVIFDSGDSDGDGLGIFVRTQINSLFRWSIIRRDIHSMFDAVMGVYSKSIASDLIPVQPLSAPEAKLMFY